jgi:hypothetical protein
MRRIVGLVLIGVGAFLVTLAPLLRTYVYDHLAVAPADYFVIQHNQSSNASYFDVQDLKVRTGVTMTSTSTVRGNVAASKSGANVWDRFTSVETNDGVRVDYSEQRTAFNPHTGYAVNCCSAFVGSDHNAKQTGLVFKFPFFTEKKSYPFYDSSVKTALPMNYAGETTLSGLKVYKFTQHVGPVRVGTEQVPGDLLGMKEKGAVSTPRVYENTRTYWVEPITGAPVRISEDQKQTLQSPAGSQHDLTAFAGDMVTTPADQRSLISKAKSQSTQVALLHDYVPLGGLVIGVLCIVGGVVIYIAGDRGRRRMPIN